MIVIPPIAINDSNLVSSTVAEPSSGEMLGLLLQAYLKIPIKGGLINKE